MKTQKLMALENKSIEIGKSQILDDISKGLVPASIKSFEELHQYVDANMYGDPESFEDDFEDYEDWLNFVGNVHFELNEWIKRGI